MRTFLEFMMVQDKYLQYLHAQKPSEKVCFKNLSRECEFHIFPYVEKGFCLLIMVFQGYSFLYSEWQSDINLG